MYRVVSCAGGNGEGGNGHGTHVAGIAAAKDDGAVSALADFDGKPPWGRRTDLSRR